MSAAVRLTAGDLPMMRATTADRLEVEGLQRAAYARNRDLLGVEPLPLLADYANIFRDMEVWIARSREGDLMGVLILEPRPDDVLIWSIASAPDGQAKGLGRSMLAAAEDRARQLGRTHMRLYTGSVLTHLVAWYGRHGYLVERVEQLPDRSITHMRKEL